MLDLLRSPVHRLWPKPWHGTFLSLSRCVSMDCESSGWSLALSIQQPLWSLVSSRPQETLRQYRWLAPVSVILSPFSLLHAPSSGVARRGAQRSRAQGVTRVLLACLPHGSMSLPQSMCSGLGRAGPLSLGPVPGQKCGACFPEMKAAQQQGWGMAYSGDRSLAVLRPLPAQLASCSVAGLQPPFLQALLLCDMLMSCMHAGLPC